VTKLHSFTIVILFLSFGQMGCKDGDDGTAQGSAQSRAKDADSAHDHDAKSGGGAGALGRDADSLPADAGAAGSGGASSGPAGSSGGDSSMGTESAETAEPGTFTHIYEMAFKTCRTQCHGMGFSMLDMKTRDMAYSQLVDHDTNPGNMKCAPLGLKRVKPGSPEESLLYLKLDIHTPCGQQMPPGGQLTQEYRDEVRDWIMNGAKDD
jgi:hypothetical protein